MRDLVLTVFLGIAVLAAIAAHAMARRKRRSTVWGAVTFFVMPAIFILLALPVRGARPGTGRRRMGAIEIIGLLAVTALAGLGVVSNIAAQFDWGAPAGQSGME